MQQRRGTAAQWISTNEGNGPILAAGEIGFESDTNKFKMGDGVNHWIDLDYFIDEAAISAYVTTAELPELTQDAINAALVAGTGLDKTYDDNGNTITLDIDSTVATKTYADSAVSTHSSDTTSVHGIADTSLLATGSQVDTAVSNHNIDTTDVHGIADTAELATKAFAASLLTGATKTNIAITGDKNGLTITAENGVADSTTDNLTEGSTNKYFTDERAQDAVGNAVGSGLSYDDASGAISVNTTTIQAVVAGVSDTEIGYLNGVTSSIQDQLDDKLDSTTAASTYQAKVVNVSDTEIGYLDGVTSSIQDQLDDKAPIASPTFTGNAVVDNLEIGGALTFTGTATQIDQTNLSVTDPLIYLAAEQFSTDILDIGIYGAYGVAGHDTESTHYHTGLFRDASDGKWKLISTGTEPTSGTIDLTGVTYDALKIGGIEATGATMTGAIAMGTNKITGLGDPTSNQDAVTKVYADAVSPALTWGQLKNGKTFA